MQPHMHHNNIVQHYTRQDLGEVILSALEKAGKDMNNLTPVDLAPLDEFHVRGRKATIELARDAGFKVMAQNQRKTSKRAALQ